VLLPLLVLVVGLAVGYGFIANPQKAEKRERPEAAALLVAVGTPEQGEFVATVEALGQVMPAVETALRSQVAGEIIQVADEFLPGGLFQQGELILQIDPEDYRLEVQKQQALLEQSQADFQLETGRQDVARDELKILARTTGKPLENPELALRAPQLRQAKAELKKARTELAMAELDLRRTQITARFNALVTERQATLEDKISLSDRLATLVSTDEYWVEISVPVEELRWLQMPTRAGNGGQVIPGSPARIVMDGGRGERAGQLLKLTGSLDSQSRLARVLVSVPDPLLLKPSASLSDDLAIDSGIKKSAVPLILGDYVRVLLQGKGLDNVVRIPLAWLRDGGRVWVMNDSKLEFRPVTVVYEDRDYAYLDSGLSADDQVVTTDIAVSVAGMRLRLEDETNDGSSATAESAAGGAD